ncbi:MAG: transglutaminase domain-containing protein [Kordia sp.]
MLNRWFLFSFLFYCNLWLHAQDYATVDKVVATYPSSFQSIEKFADRIEKDFTTDATKVRAAYYWIAHHIQYNYKIVGSSKTGYPTITINTYESEDEFHYKYKKVYATYALQYKAAVCEGYAQLLFYVCEELGIKATVIKGNAITSGHRYGLIPRNTNHAWNAVFFNDKWNLIDATWSTGNERDKPNHVDFHDTYFCISPQKMILNHFPKDPKWQLLKTPMTKKAFFTQPIIYSEYLALDIALSKNTKGLIKAKVNGFIRLRFTKIDTTKKYYYSFSKDEYSKQLTFTKAGNEYITNIPFKSTKRDFLSIFSESSGMLRFRILPTQ